MSLPWMEAGWPADPRLFSHKGHADRALGAGKKLRHGGPAWRQTIFYPFLHASKFGRGTVLDVRVHSPVYESHTYGTVPYIETAAVADESKGTLVIFAVNRGTTEKLELEADLHGFDGMKLIEHIELTHADPKAVNTREKPNEVVPRTAAGKARMDGDVLSARLEPLSWNVLRLHGCGVLRGGVPPAAGC